MGRDFDEILKEEFHANTETSDKDIQDIWCSIEGELFEKQPKKIEKFISKPFLSFYSTVAAAVIMLVGVQTEPGEALVNKVKMMFEPEKDVMIAMEGTQEPSTLSIPENRLFVMEESQVRDYVLYIDEEKYTMLNIDGVDRIVPKVPLEDTYPEVSMEIKQIKDRAPEVVSGEMEKSLQSDFRNVGKVQQVNEPLKGFMVQNTPGSEWNSPIVKHYIVSDEQGGSYVITQHYFMEAAEGHAVRFDAMLKEFHIVPKEI